jgi:hypothetical protein
MQKKQQTLTLNKKLKYFFSLQDGSDQVNLIPAQFDSFKLATINCKKRDTK